MKSTMNQMLLFLVLTLPAIVASTCKTDSSTANHSAYNAELVACGRSDLKPSTALEPCEMLKFQAACYGMIDCCDDPAYTGMVKGLQSLGLSGQCSKCANGVEDPRISWPRDAAAAKVKAAEDAAAAKKAAEEAAASYAALIAKTSAEACPSGKGCTLELSGSFLLAKYDGSPLLLAKVKKENKFWMRNCNKALLEWIYPPGGKPAKSGDVATVTGTLDGAEDTAKGVRIPYTIRVPSGDGTDAAKIHASMKGWVVGVNSTGFVGLARTFKTLLSLTLVSVGEPGPIVSLTWAPGRGWVNAGTKKPTTKKPTTKVTTPKPVKRKAVMKAKLGAAAKEAATAKGKAAAKAFKDARAATTNETAVEKTKKVEAKKILKDAWTKKKKRLFRGVMKLIGIDLSGTDAASKTKRDNFENAVKTDLQLTDSDEIVFTYKKVTTRRRLLAESTEASYVITVADDTAAAVEAALTADPDGTSIVATAAALDTSFAAITAEVSAPETEEIAAPSTTSTTPTREKLNSAPAGATPTAAMWAIGAASVAAGLALF